MLRNALHVVTGELRMRSLRRNNEMDETVLIGKRSQLFRTSWGKYSGCNSNCAIYYTKVGNYTNIASGVTIAPRSHIYTNFTTHDFIYIDNEQVFDFGCQCEIGSDVWICTNSIILPGVTIGDGSIVAAGAVVTKSVPPYAIVGGNPARIIRMRFDADTVRALQETRWWELDPFDIIARKAELEGLVGFDLDAFKSEVVFARKACMKRAGD